NLFQLERPFERDRIVDPAAQVQKIRAGVEPCGDFLDLWGDLERLLEQVRQLEDRVDMRARGLERQNAARLAELQSEQIQRDQLRRERLGRGDADLRPRVRVDGPVGLPRRHAADNV